MVEPEVRLFEKGIQKQDKIKFFAAGYGKEHFFKKAPPR
jgi:hypothetical protein